MRRLRANLLDELHKQYVTTARAKGLHPFRVLDPRKLSKNAIREAASDGNRATVADPAWTSLIDAPPYPDHPAGHTCGSGALVASLVVRHAIVLSGGVDARVVFPVEAGRTAAAADTAASTSAAA